MCWRPPELGTDPIHGSCDSRKRHSPADAISPSYSAMSGPGLVPLELSPSMSFLRSTRKTFLRTTR